MRVMLVYSNRTRIMEPAPPIGLSYVATATRQAGHDVRFVDLMISRDPAREMAEALREFQPEVVGFSIRNIDNVIAQRVSWEIGAVGTLIEIVRTHGKAVVVLGGPAASILGPTLLTHLDADFSVAGEGEIAFPQLLSALSGARDFAAIPGLCYREDGRTISVEPARQPTFGPSGMEQWINWHAYERVGGTWAIQTKRGCPMSCVYCSYPQIEGQHCRSRTPADVVDEIERVAATIGPRTFEFVDSTFNVPESHAIGICEEIIRRRVRVNLSAVSLNPLTVSRNLLAVMKQAGFCSMVITPDTASETMLRNLKKGFTVARLREAARLARESSIPCTWFFLMGGPGETQSTVEETMAFIETDLQSKRFVTVCLIGMRLLPDTPLAQTAMASGYIPADQDFCQPLFYFSPEADEAWVIQRVSQAAARHPTIVQGAEQNGSAFERGFNHGLYWLGFAPPFYRFLPTFLRIPVLRGLRTKYFSVRPSGGRLGNAGTS